MKEQILIISRVFGYLFFILIGTTLAHSKATPMEILIFVLFLMFAGHQLVKYSFGG